MPAVEPFGIGLLLALAGLCIWLAVRYFARRSSSAPAKFRLQTPVAEGLQEHGDAVLVIEAGGRPVYANSRARELFHLKEGQLPNLERLAHTIRPPEPFFQLCAYNHQASFVVDGRMVEGTSYRLALQPNPMVVVTLRDPGQVAGLADGTGGASRYTLQTFVELNQAIAASLELDITIQTILENIEKMVPADQMEIAIWDAGQNALIAYRLYGEDRSSRRLEIAPEPYRMGEHFSGRVAQERRPVLVDDAQQTGEQGLMPGWQEPPRSLLGMPLLVGNELIGALALGAVTPNAFHAEALEVVKMLSGQAAVALHNARRYEAEQRRTAELSGLAQLSQAFGSVRDPKSLFARLVQSILPLVHVELLGFVLYNETTRTLEAHAPFYGLPEQFLEMYKISVPAGSSLEAALVEQDVLLTENAAEDRAWESLGFGPVARGASLRETVLIPLASGGRFLGYLQASNHTQRSAVFTQDELHLLVIVANQAAPVIDNFTLIQQSRQRAQRAEALRRIASLASSAANLDEILKISLQELCRLLQADVAGIFLYDQPSAALCFQPKSMFGALEPLPEKLGQLRKDDPQYHFTVTGGQRAFFTGSLSEEAAVIPFYQSIQGFWGIESAVIAPLVVRDEGIGELWIAARQPYAFDKGSLQVAATAAGQLAGVVEQSYLAAQTDESLHRRVQQLAALTRINRQLSTALDLNYLLQMVYDEALATTGADCGSILLFDLSRPTPGGPRTCFTIGDAFDRDLNALERGVLEKNAPLNLPDAASAGYASHAGVQSALLVPFTYHQQQAGLMLLHSKAANRFDATAVEISQSLAVQAAVVLGNALQTEEHAQQGEALKRELETLTRLFEISRSLRPNLPLPQVLEAVGQAICSATPFRVTVISLYDALTDSLVRTHAEGLSADDWAILQSHQTPWHAVSSMLQPEYRIGSVYYIPADRRPQLPVDVHTITILPDSPGDESDVWNAHDLLFAPLIDQDGAPLGLISVDAPRDGRRPDWQTFRALELFSLQAAIMIRSHQTAARLERSVAQAQAECRELKQQYTETSERLPLLLTEVREQNDSIGRLERQVLRLRSGLEIAEEANRQPDARAVLETVAREMMARLGMQLALVAVKTPSGADLQSVIGEPTQGANPRALFGQRNPLRALLQDGAVLAICDLRQDKTWNDNAFLNTLGACSLIGLPLQGETSAGVLVLGSQPMPEFTEEDRQSIGRLARQVSIGLQNLNLLHQARERLREMDTLLDFSRKLGDFSPDSILRALLDSAMQIAPAAQAGWAGLWDSRAGQLLPRVAAGYADSDSLVGMSLSTGEEGAQSLPLRVISSGEPLSVLDMHFARDYNLPPDDLLRYRRATGGRLPVSTLIIPVMLSDQPLGVLTLENFSSQAVFGEEDENMALALAHQAGLALENARLLQSAEGRAQQLAALTRVAGALTTSLRSGDLVASLPAQLREVLPYDTATVWLRQGESLSVAAAAGFENDSSLLGLSVAVEDSQLFGEMAISGRPISVPDVRKDLRFPSLAEPDRISWIGLPLIAKGELIGVIAMEKTEAEFYTDDHLRAAATFASQAAVALDNARLFEESERRATQLDERSRRLGLLNRLSGTLGASLDGGRILQLTAQEMLSALGVDYAAAVMVNAENAAQLQVEVPEQAGGLAELPAVALFDHLRQSRGMFVTSEVQREPDLAPLLPIYLAPRQITSLMVVPLLSAENLLGWLLLGSAKETRFTPQEMELALTICNQAATAIQNARLFAETRSLTADLEQRVQDRTAEVSREHHNSQTLLRIISELTGSLDMSLVLNRTLTVLAESTGAEQSLITLAQSGKEYHVGADLAGLRTEKKGRADQQIGKAVMRERKPALLADIQADEPWSKAEQVPAFRSVLAVPLILGEDVLGSLMLLHSQPGSFTGEQTRLVEATARQISLALNNADLFNLIRDQAENLGGMLREQQVAASRSRAILEAVADGVLVTEADNIITLFNASAGRILGLDAKQVVSRSLDQFSGLFGKAASAWMQTIRNWSENDENEPVGQTYAEKLELDNGRVVSVHLAPVIMRSEFLGTVSIFRDITHEVQVDRLKSEFVANVSHELRTPMTSIKGYVDIMLMGAAGEIDPRVRHFLEIVRGNTERLSVLVNDLLDVSKIESGHVTLSMRSLDMREIAQDVIADITRRSREENKPMEFALDIAENLPAVRGDLERVRQILGNLVSNGYNYTPANGKVTVRMYPGQCEVIVDVVDNGIGIATADQGRIFERFYRGEDPLVLATAGTGLGLAITRSLIEMHGGRIWFASSGERGEGSTFSFSLPPMDIE